MFLVIDMYLNLINPFCEIVDFWIFGPKNAPIFPILIKLRIFPKKFKKVL